MVALISGARACTSTSGRRARTVKLILISPGPSQAAVTLPQGGMWNGFDIDLNAYNGVDLSNVIQLMFDKGGDGGLTEFYIDNLMFLQRSG